MKINEGDERNEAHPLFYFMREARLAKREMPFCDRPGRKLVRDKEERL